MNTLKTSEGVALFTDGSANHHDRSGGWAYAALDAFEGMDFDSGPLRDTTISQMELLAATRGLTHLSNAYGPCDVIVYSDSEYVVKGCNDRTRKRNKNKTFWRALDLAIDLHTYVEFTHIRGHNDHFYNEMVDKLAGKARLKGVK